ncbi:MAG: hypothetical protein ACLU5H_09325 [Alphaproteobacteria bacterium]
MLNIKNKSNLFLAAFVFAALASFSDFAKADVEIDCSGKEGYQLTICEQQKALAEKNAKSNEKAEDKADKKAAKAAEQATEATNAQKAADEKRKAEYSKYNEASKTAEAAESKMKAAEAAKKDAEKKMNDAIARGDTEAAKAARDEMTKQHKAAAMAYSELNSANEAKDEAYKAASKAQKEADKEKKKADKAAQKAEKEKIKAAEKAEKNANKDLKKAKKEYDKLQEKCTKDPDKCDVDALQAAQTNLMAAKRNADAATKNREDVDGTTAANEKAAAEAEAAAAEAAAAEEAARQQEIYDYMDEEAPNEAEIQAYNCKDSSTGESCTLTADNASTCKCEYKEVYTDANGNTKEGKVGTFDELDANGNPVAMQRCYEAKDDIFKYIACKAMTTLADVRVIVYTLAGFGLIAFAFAAIFNKISWKHLANLCIALFILSMMTPFISYFTQDNGAQISYGNYLPAGFTNISGSDVDAAANCDTSKGDVCPDVTVDTSAKDSKWSWKDLKNTVKSGINAAKTAYDTYKTVKNTVETTVDQAKKIGTAIKNSEGGLTGVLDTLGEVATASNTIFNTVQTGAGAVVANTSSIANDVQNAGKSGAELAFDKENQNRINELEKKLAAGNLSPEQQEWAKAELEQRKAAVDSNKVTDFANNQGQKALDKINSVAKTGSTVTNIATKASNAAQQGATIGGGIGTATGDTLGAIFGIATAAGEGIGAVEDNKQAKIDAANAEAKKQADAEAAAKRQEEIRQNNASYSQGKQWDNSYNAGMSQKQPTVQKPAVSSGDNNKNTASGSNTSGSSSGSSGNKNNNNTGNNSVTKTVTVTTGGRGGQIENVGPYLPEVTTTTSVTLENAVENWDGTITQTDPEGRKATYSSEGELINIKDAQGNLTYGKEPTYWDNYNNNMNWGQNL